jgi:hypothetical protein
MSFFYGDVKSDELKTLNGLQIQGGTNNLYTLTLNTQPSINSNYTINLPNSIGEVNQYLKINDLNGNTANLSFDTVSSGVSNVYLSNIEAGDSLSNLTTTDGTITIYAQNNNVNINALNSINVLTTQQSTNSSTGGLVINSGVGIAKNLNVAGNLNISDNVSFNSTLDITGALTTSSTANIGGNSNITGSLDVTGNLELNNNLKFNASNSNTLTLDVNPAISGNYAIRLPSALGSIGQVLKIADTTGNLEFGDGGSGGFGNGGSGGFGNGGSGGGSSSLDNITAGDALSNLTTTLGNIIVYPQTSHLELKVPASKVISLQINEDEKIVITDNTANINANSNITGTLDITGATTMYDNLTINGDLNTSNTFSLDQGSITVSESGTEVLDFADRSDFIISVSGTSTLTLACKNVNTVGQQGSIIITQTADTNSLTWATSNGWYFPSATAPTLSVGSGIYDVFSYLVVEAGGSKKILVMDATNFQAY